MAYIGRGINNLSNAQILDTITFTNSAGPYNLEQGSAAFTPISPQALVISVDGVIQAPGSYTISAATITFGVSMASTLTNDFIVHNGVGIVNVPTDGSVTAAKLATDAVETSKIKDLNVTAGKLAATQDLSTKTITLPASVSGLGTGITNSQLAGSIDVTTKITGVVPTANLGSGSASSSTYLAGDQTYKEIVATDIAWQAVTTATTLAAVAGRGYPINTTSNVCTVTLPASASVGDQIIFTDYLRTWATNNVTINQNSLKFQGNATPNPVYSLDGESVHIVYMDATQGWTPTYDGAVSFETSQTYDAEYLAVAGGGAGAFAATSSPAGLGGGGAGGLLTNYEGTAIALLPSSVYTITVGEGGVSNASGGNSGEDSVISGTGISTVTAVGGGVGGGDNSQVCAIGGSGGGVYTTDQQTGCAGTADQGYAGGDGTGTSGTGGGGAGAVGVANSTPQGGAGGAGLANSITGLSVFYAGGGGGGGTTTIAAGGSGGGGAGGTYYLNVGPSVQGTDGLGGGGGGGNYTTAPGAAGPEGGDGGNGVVILRMPDARAAAGTAANEDSTATDVGGSGETVITWLVDGSWTA